MSGGSFATNWAAILYAVPLDMVGTVTLEALNCSSGVWTDVMRVLRSRQIRKLHDSLQCWSFRFWIDFGRFLKFSMKFVDRDGRDEIMKVGEMFVVKYSSST